jgi:hypothetical protein
MDGQIQSAPLTAASAFVEGMLGARMEFFKLQRLQIFAYILENCLGLRIWSDSVSSLAWLERRLRFDRGIPHVLFLGITSAVILGIL